MRKMIVSMMVSLDGYSAAPGNDISWHNWGPAMDEYMTSFFASIDTIILGRKAYELMAAYWPNPASSAENPLIAHKMNKLPKLVFSRSLSTAEWRNSTLWKQVSAPEIRQLKLQEGKDMVIFGGAELAQAFMELDLVDEFHLIVNPVLLGKGKPLFNAKLASQKHLVLIRTFNLMGNVILHYRNAHPEMRISP